MGRFMSAPPHTIGRDQPLAVAHALMRQNHIRHLPVFADGRLVGVVSMDDLHLLETLKDVRADDTLVEEAMTGEVYSVEADTPVEEVAREMADRRLGAAVVTEGGAVAGIFTSSDALRAITVLLNSDTPAHA